MNFWLLIVALAISYLAQVGLSFYQMKDFALTYGALRRRGKVAIGKRKAALSAGSIALFLLADDGTIVEARAMSGLTVLARFKPLEGYAGAHIRGVAEAPNRLPRGLRLAVLNARDNWLAVQRGETPQDPPGPFTRLISRFRKAGKPRAHRAPRTVHTQGVAS